MVQKMPKLAFSCKNCSFGFKTGDKDDIGKTYWIYTEDEVQCTDVYEQNMFLQLRQEKWHAKTILDFFLNIIFAQKSSKFLFLCSIPGPMKDFFLAFAIIFTFLIITGVHGNTLKWPTAIFYPN